jgi:hypothetical protein
MNNHDFFVSLLLFLSVPVATACLMNAVLVKVFIPPRRKFFYCNKHLKKLRKRQIAILSEITCEICNKK